MLPDVLSHGEEPSPMEQRQPLMNHRKYLADLPAHPKSGLATTESSMEHMPIRAATSQPVLPAIFHGEERLSVDHPFLLISKIW